MTDRPPAEEVFTRLLAAPAIWAEPSADLEDEVVDAVAAAEPVAGDRPRSVSAVVRPLHRSQSRRRRVSLRVSGFAAAVLAVIGLVAGITLARREPTPAFKADLTATALGRGGGASVEMYDSDAGFRVELDAHGLGALAPGEYYEAWLRNAAGTVVAIGTFSSSDGDVTLWSGVSPAMYRTLSITIERADNQPAPSPRRVLTGVMRPT